MTSQIRSCHLDSAVAAASRLCNESIKQVVTKFQETSDFMTWRNMAAKIWRAENVCVLNQETHQSTRRVQSITEDPWAPVVCLEAAAGHRMPSGRHYYPAASIQTGIPSPARPVQLQPCMSNLGGSCKLAGSFPSPSLDGAFMWLAALNTEHGVTVAEPRWPPLIQNAPATVITETDYANVNRTVGLDLKHGCRPRQKLQVTSK